MLNAWLREVSRHADGTAKHTRASLITHASDETLRYGCGVCRAVRHAAFQIFHQLLVELQNLLYVAEQGRYDVLRETVVDIAFLSRFDQEVLQARGSGSYNYMLSSI